jgi:hypothetical protein
MVVHSSASTTKGIAPNNIVLVALRKFLAPFLCNLGCRRAHTPNGLALELKRPLAAYTRKNAGRRSWGATVRRLVSAMSLSPHGGTLNTVAAS